MIELIKLFNGDLLTKGSINKNKECESDSDIRSVDLSLLPREFFIQLKTL